MQNKNWQWQTQFFSSLSLTGREERIVFKVGKGDSMEILQTADERVEADKEAEKDFHTREEVGNTFEGIPIDKKIAAWIPALKGNLHGIKEAEAVLYEVHEATKQDICRGGVPELSKRAASGELNCGEFAELVNQLLQKGGTTLKDVPDEIGDSNHHIAIFKFPKANMIGAKWASNNSSL